MAIISEIFARRVPATGLVHMDIAVSNANRPTMFQLGYPGGGNTYVPNFGRNSLRRGGRKGVVGFTRPAPYYDPDQPRGQPGNAGQFGPGGSGRGSSAGDDRQGEPARKPPRGKGVGAKAVSKAARAADVAITATRRVMYDVARLAPQVLNIWTTVFEGPEDLQKIGYNPSFGSTEHATYDPVKDATGVSAHLAAKIGAVIVGKAMTWAKRRLTGKQTQSARYGGDPFLEAAQAYISLTNAALAPYGMVNRVDVNTVARNLAGMMKHKNNGHRARAGVSI